MSEGPVWVGAPGEDVGGLVDAGMVSTLRHSVTQDSPGLAGGAEAGDRFGSAIISFLPYYEDQDDRGYPVRVGVPGEDIGTIRDAGMVNSFDYLFLAPESTAIEADGESIDQNVAAGRVESGDRFGATLARFDFFYAADPLPWEYRALYVIGAPGEDSGAGGIVRVQYVRGELRSQIWKQETGPREAGDGFGTAVVREW